jgi:uncharacterized protein YbbK (DUF523 family)
MVTNAFPWAARALTRLDAKHRQVRELAQTGPAHRRVSRIPEVFLGISLPRLLSRWQRAEEVSTRSRSMLLRAVRLT